ncbi:MAG TPA: sugar ABC transporter permease [Alphaproteobacteria bacterium]|nr:sugar ABC transporter permease [Alphaproteobacteria bacterium]
MTGVVPRARPWGRGEAGAEVSARRASLATLFIFLAPALLLYAAFTVYPVLRTFWNSIHTIGPHNVQELVGAANFTQLLTSDRVFWKAVGNTAIFTIIATIADVLGGLLLALCLFSGAPLAKLLRVVWFTPVLMSYVVVGIIWVWIYDYDWGLANFILRSVGLGALEQSWLGDPRTALWSVMATHVWKWLGFNMIVFLAALYALPEEVLGAAELDNCGWIAKLVYVIIPMLRPTIVNLLVLSFVGKMMIFDLVWIMTGGGPLWSTETVSTYVYKRAFDWNTFDLGYPSAIAVLWFIIILVFVFAMTQLLRQRDRLEF